MNKVKKCLQMFSEKSNSRYKNLSFLDIALAENCTEKEFVEILKKKTNTYLYTEISDFACELYEYEDFKNFKKKTQHLIVLNEDINIEHVENYNDIPIKPFISYWMSYEGELSPDANHFIDDPEETDYLEFYTKVTNWLLHHNDFKPNLSKSHPIVKWAKRLSKSDAYAYAELGNILLEKLGMLESNKIDTSKMGWMELMEYKLTNSCKDFIMTKENKVHGLILFYSQDALTCWCDYKENESLSLHNIEEWINKSYEEAAIDYYISIPFDDEDQTVNDIGYLMLSIVMAKVVINLKKDVKLSAYFSENLKIGMNIDETNQKPTFHGNYFGRYTPNSKILKKIVKEYVSSKENKELIMDLIKKQPTASGLELWKELTYED
ncbi:hypothetical protein [Flavivirga algicola]|uniref:Uncharacterized protein n=1 Tax=Flavivirga algicola TaxID=2729136 RepID=A0ABX1RTN0_9FLAO|nr:hypothetical protein [Flavivirga algicola]NMH86906.1 hypothetical protein [Flavivirga algicola]